MTQRHPATPCSSLKAAFRSVPPGAQPQLQLRDRRPVAGDPNGAIHGQKRFPTAAVALSVAEGSFCTVKAAATDRADHVAALAALLLRCKLQSRVTNLQVAERPQREGFQLWRAAAFSLREGAGLPLAREPSNGGDAADNRPQARGIHDPQLTPEVGAWVNPAPPGTPSQWRARAWAS